MHNRVRHRLQLVTGQWRVSLISFSWRGSDGMVPNGGLVCGTNGVLYEMTTWGGGSGCNGRGCGTVFELAPPTTTGGTWRYKQIYVFQGGSDGANPNSYLLQGKAGILLGVTLERGGSGCSGFGCGTVFELVPPTHARGSWTETVPYSFKVDKMALYLDSA